MTLLKTTVLISAMVLICSCQQSENGGTQTKNNVNSAKRNTVQINTSHLEEAQHKEIPNDDTVKKDDYQSIINSLKGIEKHYVQNNLFKLHSLLKYNKDERSKKLEDSLTRNNEHSYFFEIQKIDQQNGYIEFEVLQATECTKSSMCYWNKSNGDALIGTVNDCCTMFCQSDITFEIYHKNNQSYTSVAVKKIIPDIDVLKSFRPKRYIDGDGYDEKYTLPRKGKNISYCVDTDCLDLIWKDGVFSVTK